MRCEAIKDNGSPCSLFPQPNDTRCKFHSLQPETIERRRAMSRNGGYAKAYGALQQVGSLGDDPAVAALDLTTPEGLRDALAATIRSLLQLPLDVRVATAIGQLVTTQRGVIETSDMQREMDELRAALERQGQNA